MRAAAVGLLLLGAGQVLAAPDFDGAARAGGPSVLESLQNAASSMPELRAVPVYWGTDGAWCAPGRRYNGGPCDLRGRRPPPDRDGYRGPQSDPYRNPTGRPPRDVERGRGPEEPRREPRYPEWWDWERPGRIARDFEFAAEAAYGAARATQGGWWRFRQRAATRDLGDLAEAARRFRAQVERGFRASPWSTERAYREVLRAYARASESVDRAGLARPALGNFRRLQDVLDELRRYYEYRP